MFARVALYEGIDPQRWKPVAAWFDEHAPALNAALPGFEGALTLVDEASGVMVGIGLYDTEEHAAAVDVVMDGGPPPGMPEGLVAVLASSRRTHRGVYAVVGSEGRLAVPPGLAVS